MSAVSKGISSLSDAFNWFAKQEAKAPRVIERAGSQVPKNLEKMKATFEELPSMREEPDLVDFRSPEEVQREFEAEYAEYEAMKDEGLFDDVPPPTVESFETSLFRTEEPDFIRPLETELQVLSGEKKLLSEEGAGINVNEQEFIDLSAIGIDRRLNPEVREFLSDVYGSPDRMRTPELGWVSDTALDTMMRINKARARSQFVSHLDHMDLSDIARTVSPRPQIMGRGSAVWKSDPTPITINVRERDGWLEIIDIRAPEHFHTSLPPSPHMVEGATTPIVVVKEDGVLNKVPYGFTYRNKDGLVRAIPARLPAYLTDGLPKFESPLSPTFWQNQPKTSTEAKQVVSGMFSPEGQVTGNSLSQYVFMERTTDIGFDTIAQRVAQYSADPEFRGQRGSTITGWKTTFKEGYSIAKRRVKEALQRQKQYYKEIFGGDPVYAARAKDFAGDTPYTMGNVYGDTNPATKDLPIVFFRTDQNFWHAGLTGQKSNFLSQFVNAREMGAHAAPDFVQADAFLPGDSRVDQIEWYKNRVKEYEEGLKRAKQTMLTYFKDGGITVPQKTLNKYFDKLVQRLWKNQIAIESEAKIPLVGRTPTQIADDLVDIEKKNFQATFGVDETISQALVNNVYDTVSALDGHFMSTAQQAFIFNGKRPLVMLDATGFGPNMVAQQMRAMPEFAQYDDMLMFFANDKTFTREYWDRTFKGQTEPDPEVLAEWQKKTELLKAIIKSEGFDHILYPNRVEVPGMPSVIVLDESQMKFTWAPLFSKRDRNPSHAIVPGLPFLGTIGDDDAN